MPSTFTPPVAQKVTPRFDHDAEGRPVPTTPQQRALYKYMRSLDRGVNVYILSDHTVQTDLSVVLSDATMSTTNVPYPMNPEAGTLIGPPEGAEGGPYGAPVPFDEVWDATSGAPVHTAYALSPYLLYWFAGGHGPYTGLSANLVTILTAAKFDNYLS